MKGAGRLLVLSLILALASCDKGLFQVHPYDVNVTGAGNLNPKNVERIEEATQGKDTLRVAFISDSHLWLSDFRDEVADINRRGDSVDFVVHCGDITDTGTTKEYLWGRDVFQGLDKPHVIVIGNHDFLGTGDRCFKVIFGDSLNFSFIAGRVKFVCLNTNATEYDYLAAVPNFDFMDEQVTADSARFDHTVVVMHARPGSEQFNNNVKNAFNYYYIHRFPGLYCCVNGHDHVFQGDDIFGDGLMWYGVPAAVKRMYLLFTFTPQGYSYEKISF